MTCSLSQTANFRRLWADKRDIRSILIGQFPRRSGTVWQGYQCCWRLLSFLYPYIKISEGVWCDAEETRFDRLLNMYPICHQLNSFFIFTSFDLCNISKSYTGMQFYITNAIRRFNHSCSCADTSVLTWMCVIYPEPTTVSIVVNTPAWWMMDVSQPSFSRWLRTTGHEGLELWSGAMCGAPCHVTWACSPTAP